jgi:uncharacterized protein YyaL (SSP411 family)
MTNRLSTATSPYLRQHAGNPVEWYPWGSEAFAAARASDRPILLSVGYAACHWCHVMAHESFEDAATAAIMNRLFVNVKVDREERPDVDAVYMQAVQAMTGRGGWPMTVFLTPDGEPFYGGTYFPPTDQQGVPSFTRLMQSVATAWTTRREAVHATTTTLRELYANAAAPLTPSGVVDVPLLQSAASVLRRLHDREHHGFGDAPKFPNTMPLDFLLRHGTRHADNGLLGIVTESFLAMARGGINDQLGGGFARYSTDRAWIVPHFEKMLYDNALLISLGTHLVQSTGSDEIERITRETIHWVQQQMTGPDGGLYASVDADSEGEEGTFYLWDRTEMEALLGDRFPFAAVAFGVTASGNFEGRTILTAPLPISIVAARSGMSVEAAEAELREVRAQLLAARATRVAPAIDRKQIASWNGLMLVALSEAARVFADDDILAAARHLGQFLEQQMIDGDRVVRTCMDGVRSATGFLEDQAAVAAGMLALYQATGEAASLRTARRLAAAMVRDFHDADSRSFYDTARDHETLITRPRELTDNAVPAGASLACDVLLRLASLDGTAEYRAIVAEHLDAVAALMAEHPLGFGHWLGVADRYVHGGIDIALVPGDDGDAAMLDVLRRAYLPTLLLARGHPDDVDAPLLLRDRPAVGGRTTAYLCRNFSCELPTTEPMVLAQQVRTAVRQVR